MKVLVDRNPKRPNGLALQFPYSKQDVENIKLCLGTSWDKNLKAWLTEGPEVLLDMQRFGIEIEWMSADARQICEGFRQQLVHVMAARAEDIEEEYAYQRQGTAVLAAMPNIILGDDMGLGKSKQSLDAAIQLGASSILILCPKTLCWNWLAEIDKWHPDVEAAVLPDNLRSRRIRRVHTIGRTEFWENPPRIVIANYEKMRLEDWPFDIEWDIVIFDEASKLKNYQTATYKNAKRLVRRAKCCWALTGTPLEIALEELYAILTLLRPAVFGNYMRFRDQHLETDWMGAVVGSKNLDLLRDRLAPFMLRRTKSEVLRQLPAKIYNNVYIRMSTQETIAYEHMTGTFNNWLDEHEVTGHGNVLTEMLRMRQFCCSPMVFTDELGLGSKFEMLMDLVEDWPNKIVVFCSFEEIIRNLHVWLDCHPEAIISGEVAAQVRAPRIQAFNEGRLGKVLVSTDAGQQGLNMTGADLIVHFDQLWNPQKMHQREDRLHRIGQMNNVTVVNMLCLDTIDVGMYQLNREREQLFEEVIEGAEEAILRRLDAPRLRRIIAGRLRDESHEAD